MRITRQEGQVFAPTEETINKVANLKFYGHIIPFSWFKHLKKENGTPYLEAMILLAYIVFWYKPAPVFDEKGNLIGWKKRFKGDLLQMSYKKLGEFFGWSQSKIKRALVYLEDKGLVRRIFRDIETEEGVKLPEVMFIALNAEKLEEITTGELPVEEEEMDNFERGGVQDCTRGRSNLNGGACKSERHTLISNINNPNIKFFTTSSKEEVVPSTYVEGQKSEDDPPNSQLEEENLISEDHTKKVRTPSIGKKTPSAKNSAGRSANTYSQDEELKTVVKKWEELYEKTVGYRHATKKTHKQKLRSLINKYGAETVLRAMEHFFSKPRQSYVINYFFNVFNYLLDDLSRQRRVEEIKDKRSNILSAYSERYRMITGKPYAYTSKEVIALEAVLKEFSEEQVEMAIERWFTSKFAQKSGYRFAVFLKSVKILTEEKPKISVSPQAIKTMEEGQKFLENDDDRFPWER